MQMMVKDTLAQIQQMSSKKCADTDNDTNEEGEDSGDDYAATAYDRAFNLREGVAVQVNILAKASRQLMEAETQKQVHVHFCN